MKLNQINFLPTYFKTRHRLLNDFYEPCMTISKNYDRITGYFGSSVFLVINNALGTFVKNGGKIRIICSPVLKDEDIEALKKGYALKELGIIESVISIYEELAKDYPNSTSLLSNLISAGVLEVKLAVFGTNAAASRLMHDKVGIFSDEDNNVVVFRGSVNETYKGISDFGNSESFDVFTCWDGEKDKMRVELAQKQFENMWNGTEPQIHTMLIPDTAIEKIKSFSDGRSVNELIEEAAEEIDGLESKWYAETRPGGRKVFEHQETALNNWEKNDRKGIFKMCTGSGKTFAALCAIREAVFEKKEIPIILVPSKILFNQWMKEIGTSFDNKISILKIGSGNPIWQFKLKSYSMPGIEQPRCIVAMYQSANKSVFLNNVIWGEHIFLICDEVHNIGSKENLKLLDVNVGARIGLSATPERYFDGEGTRRILGFFSGLVEPAYLIEDAIKDGVLCEYFYEVFEISLNFEEQEKWNDLTCKVNKKLAMNPEADNPFGIDGMDFLLFQRADIVKKAENKIGIALNVLKKHYKPGQRWIVYLDDTDQVNKLLEEIRKITRLRDDVFEYHTNTENNLTQTLSYFETSGAILLAINCLDEGVDIPSIDHAIILASSKNPRQYIQRRGRVLRRHKGKAFSYIYDCIVSPNALVPDAKNNLSIIRGEIARSMEFAKNARNSAIVMNQIQIIMNNNNINTIEGEFGYEE